MRNLSSTLIVSLVLAGCAAMQETQIPSKAPAKTAAQEKAEDAAIASLLQNVKAAPQTDYKISPADLLEVTVYRQDDLRRTLRVSHEGIVSFPLVGDVKVGGLSVIDAQDALAKKLAGYLISPQVTIFIKDYGNKKVSVLGEVQKPGAFELPTESHFTVLEAISMAGGFTAVAAKDRTRVIRTTTDGKSESIIVNITAITQQGEKDKDIALQANDIVYVPQSFF